MTRARPVRGARGRRRKQREKKKRLAEEAKLEKEKSRVKNSDLFKEDFKGKRRRRRSRRMIRLENQKKVEELTAEEQVNSFIQDWKRSDANKLMLSGPKRQKDEKLRDLWGIDKKLLPKPFENFENYTVRQDIPTFAPETYFSYNPSEKQREVGLDAVGEYWDQYDGKEEKYLAEKAKRVEAFWERFKQIEAEEEFLAKSSDSESSVEGIGYRNPPTSYIPKQPKERNKEKRLRQEKIRLREEAKEKKFQEGFAYIKKYNQMITQHMLEVAARPRKDPIHKRRTANSKAHEPFMPMLLTPEEIADAKGALRRLAVHKDNLHEILNRYEVKRFLNPWYRSWRRKYRPTYTTIVKFGSSLNGPLVHDLVKQLNAKD